MSGTTVQVKNLNSDVDVYKLCNVMKQSGKILKAEIMTDDVLHSLGVGYVVFYSHKSACDAVIEFNGKHTDIAKPLVVMITGQSQNELGFTNLYVKNFNKYWDDLDLERVFGEFGEVQHAEVATDNEGASKGFGFVNFKNHTGAENAVKLLHGKEVDGSVLYVQPHLKKEVRDRSKTDSFENSNKVANLSLNFMNLKVSNLPVNCGEKELWKLFSEFGAIESIKVPSTESGAAMSYGFVNFKERKAAETACKVMNGYYFNSYRLKVNFNQSKINRPKVVDIGRVNVSSGQTVHKCYKSNRLYNSSSFLQQDGCFGVRPKEIFSFKAMRK